MTIFFSLKIRLNFTENLSMLSLFNMHIDIKTNDRYTASNSYIDRTYKQFGIYLCKNFQISLTKKVNQIYMYNTYRLRFDLKIRYYIVQYKI